ncbi:hypothetical protein V6N13_004462 [Hibiscus sabdariffa]|uniref:Uncharacterized protein n=1 Tax=Hibiscus sabdariffa TaxID=183260 RepID=A0ABR2RYL4_9ROSI
MNASSPEVAAVSPDVIESAAPALSPNHAINALPSDSFVVPVSDLSADALPITTTEPTSAIEPRESMESANAFGESMESDTHVSLHSPSMCAPQPSISH